MESGSVRVSIWVKVIVLLHLGAMIIWTLPFRSDESPAMDRLLGYTNQLKRSPIIEWTQLTGTWQYWDMFAPNPTNTDIWGDAWVVMANGDIRRFAYPKMDDLPLTKRYVMERYRKFFDRVSDPQFGFLQRDFARTIARKMYTESDNPPVRVQIRLHYRRIKPPNEKQLTEYNTDILNDYIVEPDALNLVQFREPQ